MHGDRTSDPAIRIPAVICGRPSSCRNAVDLTLLDGHHDPGGLTHPECFAGITARFLERGTADGLDASCVASMTPPPFVTDAESFAALLKAAGD